MIGEFGATYKAELFWRETIGFAFVKLPRQRWRRSRQQGIGLAWVVTNRASQVPHA